MCCIRAGRLEETKEPHLRFTENRPFFTDRTLRRYLWRVGADGSRPPERIEVAGLGAAWPATVFSRDRLAFVRDSSDIDLYRFVPGRPPEVVAASTFPETEAAISADGHRLAFTSTRSADALQIWVSNADGSDPQQLTRGARSRGSPSWSPDARQLAFDSLDDGHYHIWIIDADGANLRQLTTDPGDQNVPRWSGDGRWIYFSWGHGSERDIWRMPPGGGPKQRVTHGGRSLEWWGIRGWSAARVSTKLTRRWAAAGRAVNWRSAASHQPLRDQSGLRRGRDGHLLCALQWPWVRRPAPCPERGHWYRSSARHTGQA
jgi:Tol biopolymer transport system component